MMWRDFAINHERCAEYVLKQIVGKERDQKFIIYPFGRLGKLVKSILNIYFCVDEYLIVDNYLAGKSPRVKSLKELSPEDIKGTTVLVCSDVVEIYNTLREELYFYIPREKCLEIFPYPPRYIEYDSEYMNSNDLSQNIQYIASMETAKFVAQNMLLANKFPNRFSLLEYVFFSQKINSNGLFLEFGVAGGESINFISSLQIASTIYGFDSFEGLPEDWNAGVKKGEFTTNGILPKVNKNVQLIKGWFDETLPTFLEKHHEKCSFIHVDSDLYSSAKTIFSLLKDRITAGTMIVFDEYFNYAGWKQHEYKAFQEFTEEYQVDFEYIGYCSKGSQVAVAIKDIRCNRGASR